MICDYCSEISYHKCPPRDRAHLEAMFEHMEAVYGRGEPDKTPMTSLDLFNRERRLQDIVTAIKLQGGKVNPDYDMEVGKSNG